MKEGRTGRRFHNNEKNKENDEIKEMTFDSPGNVLSDESYFWALFSFPFFIVAPKDLRIHQ